MHKKENGGLQNYNWGNRALVIGCICSVAFILSIAMGGMIFFRETMMRSAELLEDEDYESYDAYYVLIPSDHDSAFWQSVYKSAKEAGREIGAYVEMLGSNLSADYSREELLQIAVTSGVDGIILEADESPAMTAYLTEAQEKGIPVVTVLGDNSQGIRKSYVGVSNYNLGREYGRQVMTIREKEVKDVLVLMSADAADTSQNIIFSGIQEAIAEETEWENSGEIQVRAAAVENQGTFDAEESIRRILMETPLPDVIICLDELSTSCTYQAVVDYNMVGQIDIIGNYDSETILRAVERNVVRATISIDTQEMGKYCVEAMDEYRTSGYVSEYFSVGTNLITIRNVGDYLGGDENEQTP